MTPVDFLRAVWPDDGFYCIAVKTDHGYWHTSHETIEQAAAFVEKQKATRDIFFCVHSLREEKVWDDAKINHKTGEKGGWSYRKQTNMLEARAFFFDLDVGDGPNKYPSVEDALDALDNFLRATYLPEPMLVKSGGGVHVYWLLEDAILSHQWKVYAARMRALAQAHKLIVDPARTTDTASVLRVVGTANMKRERPRPVRLIVEGVVVPNDVFIKLLTGACMDAGVKADATQPARKSELLGPRPDFHKDIDGGNLEKIHELVSLEQLETGCAQFRWGREQGGGVDYPVWRMMLSWFNCVPDGKEEARDWSSENYADYDDDAFERAWAGLPGGAFKCATAEALCGPDRCNGCPLRGKGFSPYTAAKNYDVAPAPVVTVQLDDQTITYDVPDAPYPYKRTKDKGIVLIGGKRKNADGDDEQVDDQVIYDNDLYPLCRIVNKEEKVNQYRWRVVLANGETTDFDLDADTLYDRRKFLSIIPHMGILASISMVGKLQDYMVAYIKQLQRHTVAEAQHTHLGWTPDHSQFILPDRIYNTDGRVLPVHLSASAAQAASRVAKAGTLEKQIELLNFYSHKAYLPNQFFILASLAAPIFWMTGHHGVVVNASGEAGASKSTSLYTAASLWGIPNRFPLNGTRSGATINARNTYMQTLANLPVCVDEITHIPHLEAADMVMNITQPQPRERNNRAGQMRATPDVAKATIMLTTANTSLHGLLSTNNAAGTAGSMRVIEILFRPASVHAKFEADAYWAQLTRNYGHIGPAFMSYVVTHQEEVEARVLETMRHIDAMCQIKGSERFWSAGAACVLVACEIANQLGLLSYSLVQLKNWITMVLIPHMRGVVVAQYTTPLGVLTEFLEQINENILITKPIRGEGYDDILKEVRGQLLARYDTETQSLYVLKKAFKDYCVRIGSNHLNVLNDLNQPMPDAQGRMQRVVSTLDVKKVLGARTRLAKGQTPCFTINMAHPDVSGVFAHEVVETKDPALSPPRADLTVIENPVVPPVVESVTAPEKKTPASRARRGFSKFDLLD